MPAVMKSLLLYSVEQSGRGVRKTFVIVDNQRVLFLQIVHMPQKLPDWDSHAALKWWDKGLLGCSLHLHSIRVAGMYCQSTSICHDNCKHCVD